MQNSLIKLLVIGFICVGGMTGCGGQNQPTTSPSEPTVAEVSPENGQATLHLVQSESGKAIEIRLEGVSSAYALELNLTFDPTRLKITDADPNKEGVQLQTGNAPTPDFVVSNVVEGEQIFYVVTQIAPREPFQGSGVVATIQLDEAIETLPNITVSKLLMADGEGQPLNVIVQP